MRWQAVLTSIAMVSASAVFAAPQGEFDNRCALGLAMGEEVPTDCSINWKANDGKIYCFSNEEAKNIFLKDPTSLLEQAREFTAKTQGKIRVK